MTQLTIHFGHLNAFAQFSRAFTEKHRFALISKEKATTMAISLALHIPNRGGGEDLSQNTVSENHQK